ncbi:MAG: hypothetical protein PHI35_02050 [Victivallaceae bacterium]|nr:hypothetical protein [Victivallaceae bacterium]
MRRLLGGAAALFCAILPLAADESDRLHIGIAADPDVPPVMQIALNQWFITRNFDFRCSRIKLADGWKSLKDGKIDVLVIDCADAEIPKEDFFKLTHFASQAAAVYVSRDNKLTEISTKSLINIFTSSMPKWKYYNGNDADIHLYGLKSGVVGYGLFRRLAIPADALHGTTIFRVGGSRDVAALCGADEFSLGAALLIDDALHLRASVLRVDGVYPTIKNIADGSYPLMRKLQAATRRDSDNATVEAYLKNLTSRESEERMVESGFLPVSRLNAALEAAENAKK